MPAAIVSFLFLAFWAFCLFDALTAPRAAVRTLPKLVWVLIVVFGLIPGAVLWLVLGRPRKQYVAADAITSRSSRPRVIGPEDAPDFEERLQRGLRLQQERPPDEG